MIPFSLIFGLVFSLQPSSVSSDCQKNSPGVWTCRGSNADYQRVLTAEQHLEQFYLRNSSLNSFQLEFYSFALTLIDASENQFESLRISASIGNRSRLRQFVFRSNRLTRLDIHQIVFPQSLERISFAKNRLEILDARLFVRLKHLIELDLTENRLRRISPVFLLRQNVRIDGNPLDCHCTSEPYRTICEGASSTHVESVSSVMFLSEHLGKRNVVF